ncbi:hypothetical protein LCGC14_0396590 [marine sediment metagenome]|uniref:Uncharacterized protein n=1 Tax=marine sediment metagenome TaxID=412755 RepID=A0A0F9TG60_9ZZZZ
MNLDDVTTAVGRTKQDIIREGMWQFILEIRQYLCDTEFAPEPFTKPVDLDVLRGMGEAQLEKMGSKVIKALNKGDMRHTKQEEIRRFLESIFEEGLKRHNEGKLFAPRTTTEVILTYLRSKGVVIKVDRGLPKNCQDCDAHHCHMGSDGLDCSCSFSVFVTTQTHAIPDSCPLVNGTATEDLI